MITNWKFWEFFLASIMSSNAVARPSMFSLSRFVVGSSKASMPQFEQNVSARLILIMMDERTF